MIGLSVNDYEIFSQNLQDFDLAKVKCKHTNRKAIGDFLCIEISNICYIFHRLRDINSQNLCDLNFDL